LQESEIFLKKVFDGSVASMAARFVKSGQISDKELRALKALIEERENGS